MSRILVFTGPTLDAETIQSLLPAAEIFPPVAAGDLLRLSLEAGDLVAIIDGFYFQTAAVRHKELLYLLSCGIHVWGAASMGAMRAAELAPFGMRGFGATFRAYQNGEIDGDDEVAILHAPQDMSYLKLTEALVNIRYACQAAVTEGLIAQDVCEVVLTVAGELPFFERSYMRIWQIVASRGLSPQTIEMLRSFVLQERLNVKRQDALEMIHALQAPPQEPFHPSFEFQETSLLRNWRLSEEGFFVKGTWITYRDLLSAYQILGEDYPQVHEQLLMERLCEIAVQTPGLFEATEVETIGVLPLARQQRISLIAQFFAARYNFSMQETLPASALRWLRPAERDLPRVEQLARLSVRLWQSTYGADWQESLIGYIKTSKLFPSLLKVAYQTRHFCQTLQEQHGEMLLARLLPENVYAWLCQRWQVTEAEFDLAVLERGFRSRTDCWLVAGPFYLLHKYIGLPHAHALRSLSEPASGAEDPARGQQSFEFLGTER
jgi:hypothetical protein